MCLSLSYGAFVTRFHGTTSAQGIESHVCHAYQLSSFLLDYQKNMVYQRNSDLGLVQQQMLYGMVQKHFRALAPYIYKIIYKYGSLQAGRSLRCTVKKERVTSLSLQLQERLCLELGVRKDSVPSIPVPRGALSSSQGG